MIKILIADDHPLIREGLKKTLRDESDIHVAGEAKNGREVLTFIDEHKLDVVLMDLSMPEVSGLDVLKELRQRHPKLPVLILSMHPEDRFGIRALKAGASGYLTKDTAPLELVNAIRKVVCGGKYITPSLAEKLALEIGKDPNQPPHKLLSDREYQIFILIAQGKSINDISDILLLSVNTVNSYHCRIMDKMDLKTNIELTHYAIQNNLIDPILPSNK
jgi:two-component system invasion response regulator UvrY